METSATRPASPVPDTSTGLAVAGLLSVLAAGCASEDALPSAFAHPDAARQDQHLLQGRRRASAVASGAVVRWPTPSVTDLMDWAEAAFPAFFPGHQADQVDGPYVYRHYRDSGNYLGVAAGQVYVLGPVSAGSLLRVGTLADFAPRVYGEPREVPAADAAAARALLQAQFTALPAEIDAVKRLGFAAWLDQQLSAPRSTPAVTWMERNGYANTSMLKGYTSLERPAVWMIWQQLWLAPDAVRARAALALSEFFVVSSQLASGLWVGQAMATYWDLLMDHAFGSFRQLLERLSRNAAMGRMLSILDSRKEDETGRRPDENFARELMQLFTIGLYELNPDGTERLDAQGRRIETFDNDDVTELARVFTGYWYADATPPLPTDDPLRPTVPNTRFVTEPMQFYAFRHSYAEVNVLGTRIPANTDGQVALGMALDALFRHPNVGPFFSRQMIQRLVASNPSPAYVERVARVFNDNGRGVRGDLKSVFRAIWLDPEARGPGSTAASQMGRLSEPMLRIVQWGRTFARPETLRRYKGFEDAYGDQSPLRADSVFNFYRPGFVPPSTAMAAKGWLAPEFQVVHEASVSTYLNHLAPLLRDGFRMMLSDETFDRNGRWVGSPTQTVPADYVNELPLANRPSMLLLHLNRVMCAGRLPAQTQQLIIDAVASMPGAEVATDDQQRDRVAAALLLVMASPDYLVQT